MATNNSSVAYWENFYKSGSVPEEPSLFAEHIMKEYATAKSSIIELGCGNGRDAFFFARNGANVVAVDQCQSEIDELIKTNGRHKNLHFVAADFTDMPSGNAYDLVYSRFTLHSVTAEGQAKTLNWSYQNLKPGGILSIETRGKKNDLYVKGEPVDGERDAYIYDNHYRRFVDFDEFKRQIEQAGFKVLEASEQRGFAPFKGTDSYFIRIVAQKT